MSGQTGDAQFHHAFQVRLSELMRWRRDVRRFRADPVDPAALRSLIEIAALSPSVGNSQPWRFVHVASAAMREAVVASFERCNAEALQAYDGERANLYARLKLEGLREAPVHLAVFCDEQTQDGHGLGRRTMPEMLRYSVVAAVQSFWLAARAKGLGVGWVSILDPEEVKHALDVPSTWTLIAYLCVGYPVEAHLDPELQRHGWQDRLPFDSIFKERR
ncbi:5,6-dimethylbenzimidazole synthase [Microvirga sp. CF3016]|uniref:5,6-dimethylbenzimidazole synthase n=1 Tax=Microvirga sp. CF3016 TaxID=3110181 RepID=UPI002E7887AF|nr:5,6-dimethylbenzimidazole synthase [Microvirga sp. CF3016]MEE1610784.1 5,6-dimethylbenzimidazole synthase [Microvirga sp. CF3016]